MLSQTEMTDYVEKHVDNALKDLFRLIEIPTVTAKGGDHSKLALKELQRIFLQLGFSTQIHETKGQPIFTAELNNNCKNTLMFYDHYDVQPAEPLELWDSPPFPKDPVVRDGRIWGRGVADNKGEVIVRVSAIKMLQALRGDVPINIKFIIEGEEEVASPNLGEFTLKNADFFQNVQGCIWEFGGTNASGIQQIIAGVKGICYVQLKTKGPKKDLHSALGVFIDNPANHLIAALASLRDDKTDRILIPDHYTNVIDISPEMEEAVKKVSESFDEDKHKKQWGIDSYMHNLTGYDLQSKYYFSPTCTICGIWSGWQGVGGKTVLPATAHAKLDFRLVPNQKPEDVINSLKKHFIQNNFNVEIEWWEGYSPAYTPLNEPFVTTVKNTLQEVYQHEPVIHPWSAGSGPLYLFSDHVPVLSIGVGNAGSNAHSPNENIILEDFKQGQICIVRLIEAMENF
ncbi:MAG: M20/M25/M40 family metallo-hydrolase [Candidatus Hodarchaeales archaeon]